MDDEYEYLFEELNRINHEMAMIDIKNLEYDEIESAEKKVEEIRARLETLKHYQEVEDFLLNGAGNGVDKL
jgi:hypothetical protein